MRMLMVSPEECDLAGAISRRDHGADRLTLVHHGTGSHVERIVRSLPSPG
jgi:hypothetical protein